MYDFERNEKVIYCEEEVDESKPETEEQELILEQRVSHRQSGRGCQEGAPGCSARRKCVHGLQGPWKVCIGPCVHFSHQEQGHDGAQAQLKR